MINNLITKKNTKLEVIIEKNEGVLWGRVEDKGKFLPTPYGETINSLSQNLKELITEYVANEGKDDTFWNKVDANNLELDLKYDLQAFFHQHEYLNASAIAKIAGLNPGLVRQYSSGVKNPSAEQAKKIEDAIHKIANKLKEVAIYA